MWASFPAAQPGKVIREIPEDTIPASAKTEPVRQGVKQERLQP